MDNNDDWSSPEVEIYTDNPYYVITSELSDGTYYWNVRAKDAADNWGIWGTHWSFTIDTAIVPELDTSIPLYMLTTLLMVPVIVRRVVKRKRN